MWHTLQSLFQSVATFFFGSFASNSAQPQPSPHRSFLGNRPLASLIITNQILTSVARVACPVVSLSEPTPVTSLTSTAPSGNLLSRRYAWISSGRAYTPGSSSTGLPGFVVTAHVPRCMNFSRKSVGSEIPPSLVTYGEKSSALGDGGSSAGKALDKPMAIIPVKSATTARPPMV